MWKQQCFVGMDEEADVCMDMDSLLVGMLLSQ